MSKVSYLLTLNKGEFASTPCPVEIVGHARALDVEALYKDANNESLTPMQRAQVGTLASTIVSLKSAIDSRFAEKLLDVHVSLQYHITESGNHTLRLKATGSSFTCYKAVNTSSANDWRKLLNTFGETIKTKRANAANKPSPRKSQRVAALEAENDALKQQHDELRKQIEALRSALEMLNK